MSERDEEYGCDSTVTGSIDGGLPLDRFFGGRLEASHDGGVLDEVNTSPVVGDADWDDEEDDSFDDDNDEDDDCEDEDDDSDDDHFDA